MPPSAPGRYCCLVAVVRSEMLVRTTPAAWLLSQSRKQPRKSQSEQITSSGCVNKKLAVLVIDLVERKQNCMSRFEASQVPELYLYSLSPSALVPPSAAFFLQIRPFPSLGAVTGTTLFSPFFWLRNWVTRFLCAVKSKISAAVYGAVFRNKRLRCFP